MSGYEYFKSWDEAQDYVFTEMQAALKEELNRLEGPEREYHFNYDREMVQAKLRDIETLYAQLPALFKKNKPETEQTHKFPIGTQFILHDELHTVSDLLTTRSSSGKLIRVRYSITRDFCGRAVVAAADCTEATVAAGVITPGNYEGSVNSEREERSKAFQEYLKEAERLFNQVNNKAL